MHVVRVPCALFGSGRGYIYGYGRSLASAEAGVSVTIEGVASADINRVAAAGTRGFVLALGGSDFGAAV